jgi:hypothetical protein
MEFNEGKACDAVIRRLEDRERSTRSNIRWPEREHHIAPVEFVCDIGTRRFAFEHTGIEPFEGFMRLQHDAKTHFRPLEALISKTMPSSDYVELDMPLKATEGLRGNALTKVQAALAAYVLATVPTLPIAREGRFSDPIHRASLPGVPFEIALHRWPRSWHATNFSISQSIGGDREAMRRGRIERACRKKFPKLAAWRADGARTVLILEENDVQTTSTSAVASAFLSIEQSIDCQRPDEVYVVETFNEPWHGHTIRIDDKTFFDYAYEEQPLRYWEISPAAALTDIMKR